MDILSNDNHVCFKFAVKQISVKKEPTNRKKDNTISAFLLWKIFVEESLSIKF